MSLESFARVPLLFGPSPVHRLERLTSISAAQVEIWAKREDCNSGLAYGGNKTRKLEYLVRRRARAGLRHARVDRRRAVEPHATGRRGRREARAQGVLVQEHWVDWPDAVYDKVGNILLSRIMGAEVRLERGRVRHRHPAELGAGVGVVEERGGKPYAIPAGGSDHPLGGLGFARWAQEVAEQEQELGVFFDTVIVCSVTGSTQAGMIAGFADARRRRRVLGIDGSATVEQTRNQIACIAR